MKIFLQILCLIPICIGIILGYPLTILAIAWDVAQDNAKYAVMNHPTLLLIALFFCHFLADFTHLSTSWMLDAKRLGTPLIPIAIHAMVHGILMGIIMQAFFGIKPDMAGFMVFFQMISHLGIDVLKGKMNVWFPQLQSPANKLHWYVFGFDQYLHAVVIILMVKLMS